MNAEQLSNQIEFKVTASDEFEVRVDAKFTVRASHRISTRVYSGAAYTEVFKLVKQQLTQEILRTVYSDQRVHLWSAIARLQRANPMDTAEWRACLQEIISAARYQPDYEI